MATVTVHLAGTVSHTLPNTFWGCNIHWGAASTVAGSISTDDQDYRDLVAALDLQSVRWHGGDGPATTDSRWTKMKNMAVYLKGQSGTKALIQAWGGARVLNGSVTDTTNVAPASSGYAPSNMADLYEVWDEAGVDVWAFESTNEPAGFGQGSSLYEAIFTTDGTKNAQWAAVQHRTFSNAVKNRASSRGKTVKSFAFVPAGGTQGNTSLYRDFLDGTITNWPWSDDNMDHFDAYSWHPYPGSTADGTNQDNINAMFWSSQSSKDARVYGRNLLLRSDLDSRGGEDKEIHWGETALFDPTAEGALGDVCLGIMAARHAGTLNLNGLHIFALSVGFQDHDGDGWIDTSEVIHKNISTGAYRGTTRYYVLRDIVGPFLNTYPKQFSPDNNTIEVTGSGTSPMKGTVVPGQQRIQCAAGLKSDLSEAGIIIANIDLATAESVTIDWQIPATGNVTATRLNNDHGFSPMQNLGQVASTGDTGMTLSTSMLANGEVILLRVPISGTSVGVSVNPPAAILSIQPRIPVLTTGISDTPSATDYFDSFATATDFNDVNSRHAANVGVDMKINIDGDDICEFVITAGSAGTCGLQCTELRNLTGAQYMIEWSSPANTTGVVDFTQVKLDEDNYVQFRIEDGNFVARKATTADGVSTEATLTYDSDVMRWVRFRESGGTLYWEYASDISEIEWEVLHSESNPFDMTPVLLETGISVANALESDVTASIKNLNYRPKAFLSRRFGG